LNRMLSKLEVDILIHLSENELLDPMNSRTIKNISKAVDINYFRTRTNVNHLFKLGYISMGFRERASNTYYLSKKGVEMINEKT